MCVKDVHGSCNLYFQFTLHLHILLSAKVTESQRLLDHTHWKAVITIFLTYFMITEKISNSIFEGLYTFLLR